MTTPDAVTLIVSASFAVAVLMLTAHHGEALLDLLLGRRCAGCGARVFPRDTADHGDCP